MASRKGKHYQEYMDKLLRGEKNVTIPYSTWSAWLRKGKITVEKLHQLGIKTNQRKRRTPRVDLQREDSGLGSEQQNHEVREANADQHHAVDCNVSDASSDSQDGSAPFRESDSDSDSDNAHLDREQTELSDRSHTDSSDSSGDSDSENNDPLLADTTRLLSILNNQRIGPTTMNEKLHPNLDITKFEVLLMILHLSMRHRMTDVFLNHLFEFAEKIVGMPKSLHMSKHLFHKLFQCGRRPTQHFYCPKCSDYLGVGEDFNNRDVTCEREECDWSSTASSLNSRNYFLTLEMRQQITDVLSRPGLKLVSKQRTENVLTDFMDGLEYQHIFRDRILPSEPDALTLTINTDGSPIFKSGNNSLWPVHFYINELDPSERFCAENVPNIQVFLKPIVEQLIELETSGVVWTKPDGSTVESPIYVLSCCCDSVARPKVQCHMQFNGAYACAICMHPNTTILVDQKVKPAVQKNKKRGTKRKADQVDEEVAPKKIKIMRYLRDSYPLRSNQQLREHMEMGEASPLGPIMGCTGKSVLAELKQFNVVYGFVIYYMHAVLLGTMKKMAFLWFDSSSSGEPYYIGLKIDRVNQRLSTITPTNRFRAPRPMSDRVHWKANEWRAFLLYFGLVVVHNILPIQYYNHFKKLVSAIYILCKESILNDEVVHAHNLLSQFVHEFQDLYGEVNMVYNVHITGHLARLVARMGPLSAYSAFPFESANGRLVNLAMGTKGVATQICRKYLMTHNATKLFGHGY
ncbi:hypothetical protein FOCC_FOCC013609 [Frankliniella occidentalis]|uniref:Uncharacterized protein LOC113208032 n=1 Tax=Frankliniella occidentalis TaxID=133901 RepID=A0A6J1SI32_FRAOC|nr:uncharacterized protein LOC113208032 [Frankliniella occidentalis]KAE8740863.1 hypothetical protein FOCC_FOCC013609 [Frankliniella occidentalis]